LSGLDFTRVFAQNLRGRSLLLVIRFHQESGSQNAYKTPLTTLPNPLPTHITTFDHKPTSCQKKKKSFSPSTTTITMPPFVPESDDEMASTYASADASPQHASDFGDDIPGVPTPHQVDRRAGRASPQLGDDNKAYISETSDENSDEDTGLARPTQNLLWITRDEITARVAAAAAAAVTEPTADPEPAASGPRPAKWSECKTWKIFEAAEEEGVCPHNIDELVALAEQKVGKPLSRSYQRRVDALKAVGFDQQQFDLGTLSEKCHNLEREAAALRKRLADLENELAAPGPSESPQKKRKLANTPRKPFPNATQLPRPTVRVPMSAASLVIIDEQLLDRAVGLVRSVDTKDWDERARIWLMQAEYRAAPEWF
jgi:hypothetical protein